MIPRTASGWHRSVLGEDVEWRARESLDRRGGRCGETGAIQSARNLLPTASSLPKSGTFHRPRTCGKIADLMRPKRQKVALAFLGSVLLHAIALLLFAVVAAFHPPAPPEPAELRPTNRSNVGSGPAGAGDAAADPGTAGHARPDAPA